MRKSLYIVLAVVIAAGMTVAQAMVANSIVRRNETEVCIAAGDIKSGNIISEEDIETAIIYKGEFDGTVGPGSVTEIRGMTASRDIPKGGIIGFGDYIKDDVQIETDYMALEVSGDNFNAGFPEKGDFADLYMMPDLTETSESDIIWLNGIFAKMGIRFIPGRQPGVLIEDVLICGIDTATGQTAKYVSIGVSSPLGEAIAFLEQISVWEFICK